MSLAWTIAGSACRIDVVKDTTSPFTWNLTCNPLDSEWARLTDGFGTLQRRLENTISFSKSHPRAAGLANTYRYVRPALQGAHMTVRFFKQAESDAYEAYLASL